MKERLASYERSAEPHHVMDPAAYADASGLVAEARATSWSQEVLLTLGWFFWYRCVAQRTSSGPDIGGPDFLDCLEFFAPLLELCPEKMPDQIVIALSQREDQDPANVLEEAARLGNQATAHVAAYESSGDPQELHRALTALQRAVAIVAAVGASPVLWQVQLVNVLLRWHLRFGDAASLDSALHWAGQTVEDVGSSTEEHMVALLLWLGNGLLEAHGQRRDRRLLRAAVTALHQVQARNPDRDSRQQARLRLTVSLVGDYLDSREAEPAEAAAEYVRQAVADHGPEGRRAQELLETYAELLPINAVHRQPALLAVRAHVLRSLARTLPANTQRQHDCLTELGLCLRVLHRVTGETGPLDEAIDVTRSVLLAPGARTHPTVEQMVSLANALRARAAQDRRSGDAARPREVLEEALDWARRAVDRAPRNPVALSCLGNMLADKARSTGDEEVARESALLNRTAARRMDPREPAHAQLLLNAGLSFRLVAASSASVSDADGAVDALREALAEAGRAHPANVAIRSELGQALTERAVLAHDRHAAVEGCRLLEALAAEVPPEDVEWQRAKYHLIKSYRVAYEVTEEAAFIEKSLLLAREYLDSSQLDDRERGFLLHECSYALSLMYTVTHDKQLLDELLIPCRAAPPLLPEGSRARAEALLSLGTALVWLYQASGDSAALHEGINTLELISDFPRDWSTTATALAFKAEARLLNAELSKRLVEAAGKATESNPELAPLYDRIRSEYEDDLDAVVALSQEALALHRADDPERVTSLSRLAVVLLGRAAVRKSTGDAEEAAALLRLAIATAPAGHPDQPLWRMNLAGALVRGAADSEDCGVLVEAEAIAREAVAMARENSMVRARAQGWLEQILALREDTDGATTAERLDLLSQIQRARGLSVDERIRAAAVSGKLTVTAGDWTAAADHFESAVDLLPHLVGLQLIKTDREGLLEDKMGLVGSAAACAVELGDPVRALRILERGRGILLGQLTTTHLKIDDLRHRAPHLAEEFTRLTEALNVVGGGVDVHGAALDEHRLTTHSWERVCEEIRELSGFETFLRPGVPDIGELSAVGPVVVVNLSTLRSDAILLVDGQVRVVPLPGVDIGSVWARLEVFLNATFSLHAPDAPADERWRAGAAVGETLAWLWEAVTEPVLDALGFATGEDRNAAPTTVPRLWWCPTGMLSFLPLHAAGRYTTGAPHGVADYVASSYTITLNSLHASLTRPVNDRGDSGRGLLVVATSEAPGQLPLPRAGEDARSLTRLFPKVTVLSSPNATREAVLREMPAHSWAHFACHSDSNAVRQSANRLVLDDGSLTMYEVSALSIDADLAFLAACGSAAGAIYLADEAQHIASGFQLAGYRHVIATLWEVADVDAADVTTALYQKLSEGVPAAEAVHTVTCDLRDRYPRSPWIWAPYLHIGA
nr:CHAT domain-containing protein [Streptomyces sp. NBC_00974]